MKIIYDNKRLFNYSTKNLETKNGEKAQKLATVISAFPEFALLRKLYQYIELLYEQQTREEAERVWEEWQALLPPSNKKDYSAWCDEHNISPKCFEGFQSLTRSGFTQYKPYILNYFNPGCQVTNAATEGCNNLIGGINSSGNGYKFKHLRAKALYASLIQKRVKYTIDVKTVASWKPTNYFITSFNFNSGSCDYIIKFAFGSYVEDCDIPPVNVLTDNTEFFKRLKSDKEPPRIPDFTLD